jgi:hypothetical protein
MMLPEANLNGESSDAGATRRMGAAAEIHA